MSTSAIRDILSYPNGTPIEALQAKIAQVYESRTHTGEYGKTSVQNLVLEDSTGSVRASIWGHPDLTDHKGREYVFGGGRGGKGLTVKHGKGEYSGKVELSISKNGTLQQVEVYHANAGSKPTEAVSRPANASNQGQAGHGGGHGAQASGQAINGAKVGMALNNAVLMLGSTGDPYTMEQVKARAIDIIRLSNDLESGRIVIDAPVERPAATPPIEELKAANLVQKDGKPNPEAEEDVPY
jgi:hypothetical protein